MNSNKQIGWLKHFDFTIIDLLSLFIVFSISYFFKFNGYWYSETSWVTLFLIIILFDLLITVCANPYSGIFRKPYYEEIAKNLLLSFSNFVLVSIGIYSLKVGTLFSREVLYETYIGYFVLGSLLKYIWKKLLVTGVIRLNINQLSKLFIVCENDKLDEVKQNVMAGDFEIYDLVGSSNRDDFIDIVLKNNVQDVFIAIDPKKISNKTYQRIIDNGINLHFSIESIISNKPEKETIERIGVYPSLTVGNYIFSSRQQIYFVFKRLMGIVFGLIGTLLLIPVSIILRLAYWISGDFGKLFYKHERIGKDGKKIYIYKFRSMAENADEILKELLKDPKYKEEWDKNQKFEKDPRITKVGNFIRRTSIDELPQFINVLKGDMSLIGPRPLVEGELEAHDGLKLYTKIKPGITGWWGCNGRSNIEYRERLELEYYYIKNVSLYLDLLCIFRTIICLIKKEGSK